MGASFIYRLLLQVPIPDQFEFARPTKADLAAYCQKLEGGSQEVLVAAGRKSTRTKSVFWHRNLKRVKT